MIKTITLREEFTFMDLFSVMRMWKDRTKELSDLFIDIAIEHKDKDFFEILFQQYSAEPSEPFVDELLEDIRDNIPGIREKLFKEK